jgi:hypothetical protein
VKRLALAIALDRRDLPELLGVSRFASRGLAILHGPAPPDVLSPSFETIEAYASTIAQLHARETILPLRFGSLHDSVDQLENWLRVFVDEWRANLDEVEGCDEMGLRILLDEPQRPSKVAPPRPPSDSPGTSYLKALKARLDVSDALLAEASRISDGLRQAIGETARRSTVEVPSPGRERLLSLNYLVPRPKRETFRKSIETWQARWPGKLLLTGPWPPYSFAGPTAIPRAGSVHDHGQD